jgi:hypothetical protein
MFGLAAVRRERIGDSKLGKFDSQSVPMIAVGRCSTSNGLLFYNPVNSTFVSSVDYKFHPIRLVGHTSVINTNRVPFSTVLMRLIPFFHRNLLLTQRCIYIHTHHPLLLRLLGYQPMIPNMFTQWDFKMDLCLNIQMI